jgi:hypothetical protein
MEAVEGLIWINGLCIMNETLHNDLIDFDVSNERLTVTLRRSGGFNFFHLFMLSIFGIGQLGAIQFIVKSISVDNLFFVLFGLGFLWMMNNRFRIILLLVKGTEVIKIGTQSLHYIQRYGPLRKDQVFKLNEIQYFHLTPLSSDPFSQASNMFTEINYGVIVIGASKKRSCWFGGSLEKEELVQLHEELAKRIQLPSR